jgi:hypothetical protein
MAGDPCLRFSDIKYIELFAISDENALQKFPLMCTLSNLIVFISKKHKVYETFRHIGDNGTYSEGLVTGSSSFHCLSQYVRYWGFAFSA